MKEFQQLLRTTEHLMGPEGCPWDRVQTMKSTRPCITEEAHELVDAIDSDDNVHIKEELGDLLFVVLFLCKLAEKENRCTLSEVLLGMNDKLIRRHPHVFGDAPKLNTVDELLVQWKQIKKEETVKSKRKSSLDSIPKGLPALARAQKVYKKMHDYRFPKTPEPKKGQFDSEEALGKQLWETVMQAEKCNLDAEHALRMVLSSLEGDFREFEQGEK
jgi:tetrapyrrole methylase family protein/MazG family protein